MTRPYTARDHLPTTLLTAAQVRQLDQLAIEQLGGNGFELMCRAAEAAFACLLQHWPQCDSVVVLAGPGNNGGDGYVLAALAAYHGMRVQVLTLGDHQTLSDSATSAREMAQQAGVDITPWQALPTGCDLLVDAIFGIGLNSAVGGDYAVAIEAINQHPAEVMALDIASGLHADSGAVLGCAVQADVTVTFIGVKRGLLTCDGPDVSGDLAFASLSVSSELLNKAPDECQRISWHLLQQQQALPGARRGNSHKGEHGHALLVGGNEGMAGAISLAAEAGYRTGAGLVSVATVAGHGQLLLMRRPEVMASEVYSGLCLPPMIARATALGCGPGLGQDSWAQLMLQVVLEADVPLVLDADALNLLAQPQWQQDFCGREVVLTPHPGEAARLLGQPIEHIQADRFGSALALAKKYQAVVVLKGQGTVIAHVDGRSRLCTDGNPGMACGGMGDVLTGVISAFLAQGHDAWLAAQLGVCVHSAAADLEAQANGSRGLLASDLMQSIRSLVNV